ncbi:site-specific integrase [Acinetobacter sp. YH16044]|uniref:site-specific integrase n=1 Tax=Acinetobacter sp. YH16044 TaxID=2601187 RepID=UPI0015D14A17|nr:site-specific integrase [Acinetobacter sp. YH16044]
MDNKYQEASALEFNDDGLFKISTKYIRYEDDFTEKIHTFRDVENDSWEIYSDGCKKIIVFNKYKTNIKNLIKLTAINILTNLSSSTLVNYIHGFLKVFSEQEIIDIIKNKEKILYNWEIYKSNKINSFTISTILPALNFLKNILIYLSVNNLLRWNKNDIENISNLKRFKINKYAKIKSGDCFLNTEEEAKILNYISKVSNYENLTSKDLDEYCVLILFYQFGVRPKQVGMLRLYDLKTYKINKYDETLHVKFQKIKQRHTMNAIPLVRKIKTEWIVFFKEKIRKTDKHGNYYFFSNNKNDIREILRKVTIKILGYPINANIFRHSVAQRLVESGANLDEVSSFLGHTYSKSALIYFQVSAQTGVLINKALGISNIYSKISKITHGDFISIEELNNLNTEKYIESYPHGIAISGIGGCDLKQNLCKKNPVFSCYGCDKFLPLNDKSVHENVLENLRSIIKKFKDSSLSETHSPAYMQLKSLIFNIESLIHEIEEKK